MRQRQAPRPPHGGASGAIYERAHALGAMPQDTPPFTNYQHDKWEGWTEIPAFYTVSIDLAGPLESTQSGSTPLRPEPFVLKRITFANTTDALFGLLFNSIQARCVEITWQDEFTRFFGEQPCLIAAAFGDSNGFLDLPAPVLFQGRQSLQVNLRRVFLVPDFPILSTRFDFQFQGVALLAPGVGSSGSVR